MCEPEQWARYPLASYERGIHRNFVNLEQFSMQQWQDPGATWKLIIDLTAAEGKKEGRRGDSRHARRPPPRPPPPHSVAARLHSAAVRDDDVTRSTWHVTRDAWHAGAGRHERGAAGQLPQEPRRAGARPGRHGAGGAQRGGVVPAHPAPLRCHRQAQVGWQSILLSVFSNFP